MVAERLLTCVLARMTSSRFEQPLDGAQHGVVQLRHQGTPHEVILTQLQVRLECLTAISRCHSPRTTSTPTKRTPDPLTYPSPCPLYRALSGAR